MGTVTEINDFLRLFRRALRAPIRRLRARRCALLRRADFDSILRDFAVPSHRAVAPDRQGAQVDTTASRSSRCEEGRLHARIDGQMRVLDGHEARPATRSTRSTWCRPPARERGVARPADDFAQGVDAAVGGRWRLRLRYRDDALLFAVHLMCPTTGVAFEDPAPHTFSFNPAQGGLPSMQPGWRRRSSTSKIIPI